MSILNNTKHNKYEKEYNQNLTELSQILDANETDETKKKSKQLTDLITEQEKLNQAKKDFQKEIKAKQNKVKELKHVFTHYRGASNELTKLKGIAEADGPDK
jgi:uncharacterized protein YlxW (UPF0749 family)